MRHIVFFTLYRWLSGTQGGIPPCIPDSHLYKVKNTRCRMGTVFSWRWAHTCQKHVEKSNNLIKYFSSLGIGEVLTTSHPKKTNDVKKISLRPPTSTDPLTSWGSVSCSRRTLQYEASHNYTSTVPLCQSWHATGRPLPLLWESYERNKYRAGAKRGVS